MTDKTVNIVCSLLIFTGFAFNAQADTGHIKQVPEAISTMKKTDLVLAQPPIHKILLNLISKQSAISKVKLGMVFSVEDLNIATDYLPDQQYTTDYTDRILGFYLTSRF